MFSDVLKEVTSIADRRFLMVVLFPSLLFWGLLIIVISLGNGSLFSSAKAWDEQENIFKVFEIVGFVAWIAFFASLLSSQLTAILRFYEGYWSFSQSQRLGKSRKKRHQEHLSEITYEEIYLGYPLPTQLEEVMPTRLGNILKNSELYPRDRYKIDAALIWPRLYNLLPEHFIKTIADARSDLDFMLVISFLSGSFALLSGVSLMIVGAAWWFILLCLLGGLFVSWIAYKGALGSAVIYAQQIKAAFDLYRNELLKQMHLSPPDTPKDEKILWYEICQFLYRNLREKPELWIYTDATSSMIPKGKNT